MKRLYDLLLPRARIKIVLTTESILRDSILFADNNMIRTSAIFIAWTY